MLGNHLGNQTAVASIVFSSVLLGLFIVVVAWQLSSRRKARAITTGGTEYRQLADDYRRLSELAVTAQEHTDLRLEEVKVQLGQLRVQLESVHKILKEVE
jgi:Tfp pilus assembly protein PilO